jgi:hypothetical protein
MAKPEKKIEYAEEVIAREGLDTGEEETEELEEVEEVEEVESEEAESEETEETIIPPSRAVAKSNGQGEMSEAQLKAFERRELAKKVPGYGHLFHVEEEYLPESCRIPKAACFAFAARDMQQGMIDLKRVKSAWDLFKNPFMRYTIAEDGKGREEDIQVLHITDEERQAASSGGLHD